MPTCCCCFALGPDRVNNQYRAVPLTYHHPAIWTTGSTTDVPPAVIADSFKTSHVSNIYIIHSFVVGLLYCHIPPPVDMLYELSLYVGIHIFAIAYGIYLGIYFLSALSLLANTNTTRAQRTFYITYGSVLFLLNTINFVGQANLYRIMWITDRDKSMRNIFGYYNGQSTTSPSVVLGNMAQSTAIFLADALLIYRCYIIFGSRWHTILLPALCAVGSIILSTVYIPITYGGLQVDWALANKIQMTSILLTTAANIMATSMIVFKILSILYSIRGSINSQMERTYTSIVALLVESAAPSAVLGIITSTLQILPPPTGLVEPAVFFIWSSSIIIFPQFIIFRIAQGIAWTKTTSQELTHAASAIEFIPQEDISGFGMQTASVDDGFGLLQNG